MNSLISSLCEPNKPEHPRGAQGYSISVTASAWNNDLQMMVIKGFDDEKTVISCCESSLIDGAELYLALKDRGILVRHFTLPRIKNFNRITIGTREEMEALISEIQKILKEKKI